MSLPTQSQLFADLPDHASDLDDRALAIDKVGIKSLSYPIQVLDRDNNVQHTIAEVNLYVGLPHHFKGTHMSRFIEVLNARRGEMTIRNMPEILTDIQRRLEADDAHIELSFPYFISKRAPVSGVESLMEYRCSFQATKSGEQVDFVLAVQVPVKSLCPCSKSISEYGAHNQRSLVDVEIRSSDFVWIEDVVEAVEGCASAPLFALLKREDEKYVTELAYDNPKFVEDLVRDVVIALRELPGVSWMRVSAENQESIHNHSAYGEIEWSRHKDDVAKQVPLSFPEGRSEEPKPFGQWLKETRRARCMSQALLADALGVSKGYLSKVESGAQAMSQSTLGAVARVTGLDEAEVCLRAGVVPDDLLRAIQGDLDGFRAWASRNQPKVSASRGLDAPGNAR